MDHIRLCAWCNKNIDLPDTHNRTEDTPITHGMCNNCARKILSFKVRPLREFLNQFSDPVFLVNSDVEIITANNAGFSVLNKAPDEVDNKLGGEAFSCKYAKLPQGCGNTLHCKTCTIRNTIKKTLKTGQGQLKIPAYADYHFITGEKDIKYFITTEKVGNTVLLRIDDIDSNGFD